MLEAIILFGSRARSDNDDESDWDLCVILPDNVEWAYSYHSLAAGF